MRDLVKNVPDYAKNAKIWVARKVLDDEEGNYSYWFYGAYDDSKQALKACNEIGNGIIIYN